MTQHIPTPRVASPAAATLAMTSHDILTKQLEAYGNVLSDQHREVLMRMIGMYSLLIYGRESGRWPF